MRCLIRADATIETGTGHVMRCLTLAEELLRRGHEVVLRGDLGGIAWLWERVQSMSLTHVRTTAHVLGLRDEDIASFDVAVVDSYEYSVADVSAMAKSIPTLVIIDGDDRGILAPLFLDQNLGAVASRAAETLVGPRFALVRDDFVARMRPVARPIGVAPQVLAFMGGSDPFGSIIPVARSLSSLPPHVALRLVVADRWRGEVASVLSERELVRLIEPTPGLPALMAAADVIVSATGTSAWEICTIGVPAVFVAVIENQLSGFRALIEGGLALGADLTSDASSDQDLAADVERLLVDEQLRKTMFSAARSIFDGRGTARVADALEDLVRSESR